MSGKASFNRFLLFALLFLAGLYRHREIILVPDVWLDDGSPVFSDIICRGLKGLFIPFEGTLLLIPKFFALLSYLMSKSATFSLFVIFPLAFSTWTISRLIEETYEWLIPSRFVRAVTAILFCFGPGTIEVQTTLIGISSTLGTFFLLVLLEEPPKIGAIKLVSLVLASISTPLFPIYLLFAGVRYVATRNRTFLKLGSVSLITVFVHMMFYQTLTTKIANFQIQSLPNVLVGVLNQFYYYGLSLPLLGESISNSLIPFYGWMKAIPFIGVCLVLLSATRIPRGPRRYVFLGLFTIPLTYHFLHIIGRAYAIDPTTKRLAAWSMRWAYLDFQSTVFATYLFYQTLLSRRLKVVLMSAFLSLNISGNAKVYYARGAQCASKTEEFLKDLARGMESPESISTTLIISSAKSDCNPEHAGRLLHVQVSQKAISCLVENPPLPTKP